MTKVEELITDAAIDYAWGNANFGSTPRRQVLSDTVLKIASGYSTGSTAMAICFELGLIRTHPARLTKKGKEYLLASFYKITALSQSPVWVPISEFVEVPRELWYISDMEKVYEVLHIDGTNEWIVNSDSISLPKNFKPTHFMRVPD